MKVMSEEAKKARRDYHSKWRKKNQVRIWDNQIAFWERKAAEAATRRSDKD